MYEWQIDPKLSRVDYQSFLRDLTRVAKEGLANAVKPNIAEARRGLPRPAQFKGRNAPTVRETNNYHRHRPNLPHYRNLKEWTDDRFDPLKYYAVLEGLLLQNDADPLVDLLDAVFWNGGQRVLETHFPHGFWTFNLYRGEIGPAGRGFVHAKVMLRQTLRVLTDSPLERSLARPGREWVKPLLQLYFFSDEKLDGSVKSLRTLHRIRKVYSSVNAAFGEGHNSVILCKADGRYKSGRESLAYVDSNAPIKDGAMIFLGDSFFRTSSSAGGVEADAERGCTILHEATHLFAGTEDVVYTYKGKATNAYGPRHCLRLPSALAVENADSYGLFAHSVHQFFLKGTFPQDISKTVKGGSFAV